MHGADDVGGYYHSIYELWKMQAHRRDELYQANDSWWDDSGYGGATDEAAMIGDDGSETDVRAKYSCGEPLTFTAPRAFVLHVLAGCVLLPAYDLAQKELNFPGHMSCHSWLNRVHFWMA
mgnify:CR=1 FL=1